MYWDLLLCLNTGINYCLLYCAARLGDGRQISVPRLIAGAFVGALPALAVFYPAYTWVFSLPGKLSLAALMVVVSFYPFSLNKGIKYWIYLHLVSFVAGGVILALSLLGLPATWGEGFIIASPKAFSLAAGILLLIAAVIGLENHRSFRRWVNNCSGKLSFQLGDCRLQIPALVDTGNLVREPATGLPVVIVPAPLLRGAVPEAVLAAGTEDLPRALDRHPDLMGSFHLITFNSLGKGGGMMAGFRIGGAIFTVAGVQYALGPVIIAVSRPSWQDSMPSALLPGQVLAGAMEQGS